MVRHNNKLFATAALAVLIKLGGLCHSALASDCAQPLSELLIGSDKAETANAVIENSNGFLVFGARTGKDKKSQAFAWGLDVCGDLKWKMSLASGSGSNFLTGSLLPDGNVLLGGSAQSWDAPLKSDALIVKLDKNGNRLWSMPFQGEQNLAVTNLLPRGKAVVAVLQPYTRKTEGEAPQKLKPEEERPIFVTIDASGALIDQFTPLPEEKAKLFHISEIPGTSKLLASGRFSYFGQPTRPGIWEIDREAETAKRLYSGDTIGLSFGSHSDSPNTQHTLLWRSRLGPNASGDPISLTRLDDGLPQEIWTVPRTAAATLPATSLRARNGDFVVVLQSFPKKEADVTISVSRISSSGKLIWSTSFVRANDSAVTSIIQRSDRTFLLAGRTKKTSSKDGDVWLLAIGADGAMQESKNSSRF